MENDNLTNDREKNINQDQPTTNALQQTYIPTPPIRNILDPIHSKYKKLQILIFIVILLTILGSMGSLIYQKNKQNKLREDFMLDGWDDISPTPITNNSSTVNSDLTLLNNTGTTYQAYAIELTKEQYELLMQNNKQVSFDITLKNATDTKATQWQYIVGPIQNREYLAKENLVCQIDYLWCGGLFEERYDEERNRCIDYDIDLNDPEAWLTSNSGQCCRFLQTGRQYVLSCTNTDNPNEENNKKLLNNILNEKNIDCSADKCITPLIYEMELILD